MAAETLTRGAGVVLEALVESVATGVVVSAGILAAQGTQVLAESSMDWPRSSPSNGSKKAAPASSGITVRARCSDCQQSFSTVMDKNMPRQCNACQFQRLNEKKHALARQQEAEDLALLHLGIFCDECCSAILGTRYACTECEDFDLCQECHDSNPEAQKHAAQHAFTQLVPGQLTSELVFFHYNLVQHEQVYCDGCCKDVAGSRRRCTVCPYFDLVRGQHCRTKGRGPSLISQGSSATNAFMEKSGWSTPRIISLSILRYRDAEPVSTLDW
ncbi:hypothetical protein FA10DRAFT_131227 [Acaromyces ingoldii]|uniref:ZZ-type domain-containing protein n=1 Tax=Acaromyces ingoldii TaxID=215250 RepID=A0A316YH31_9BASI|nr:hypothetical protein FA10DRAFT_131227 [Acaromyces ingoldii]PWN88850.1 hypothetical protein FA10DRAFT_131227 [Acaromyces ingoldii]